MKHCSHCHNAKPLDDFSPSKAYKDGHASRCKACQAAIMRLRRVENPRQEKAQRKKDNKKWRESPQGIAYHIKNAVRRRQYILEYTAKNADHIAAVHTAYYQSHKAEFLARTTAWRKANPEKWTAIHARWVAHKKGASVNDFTHEQWVEILEVFDHRCAYCPSQCSLCKTGTHELTQDHVWPLSKGGPHTASNIVPACRSCNASKNAGDVPIPVQPLLLTLAPAKQ